MFQPSALHTDFARQLQNDRRMDIAIARRSSGEGRARLAVLTAALLRRFRRTAPVATAAEATPAEANRPAAVC